MNSLSDTERIKWKANVVKIFARNKNKALNYKQIGSRLSLKTAEERAFLPALFGELIDEGHIVAEDRGKFRFTPKNLLYQGKVDMTSTGAAYVVVDELDEDIYIASKHVKNALHGDKVTVQVDTAKSSRRLSGSIVSVDERSKTDFVGVLEITKNYAFLVPDSRKMDVDIFLDLEKLGEAKNGQKALVRITEWPETAANPQGELLQILGNPGEHEVEIHSILAEFGLPYEFPPEVIEAAAAISHTLSPKEIAKRRDMRAVPTFTIDPIDAKDFDDALSFQTLENGHYEIGVHIADVTHYVTPGDIIDKEAYERATSVYLVDRVVPMLPEVLSNNLCSLRPNEDKLTFSAIFEMDDAANIHKVWLGRTVTHSDHRFAYEDAQVIIEGADGPFRDEILKLDAIAKVMRKNRFNDGAISFDKKEMKFHLDEAGNPVGVYHKVAKNANHLIEEFMLLANKKVAEFAGKGADGAPSGKRFVYRVHNDPDPEKIAQLNNFVQRLGYQLDMKNRQALSQSMNRMLADVKGKGEANMIETLTVRSMAKAIYDTNNVGHYGLAFDYYTHFTSPIRRYPDVIVHRLLQHYLDGKATPKENSFREDCKHSSEREKMASDAERASIKYMQVKFMQDFLDYEFDGVISGVTEWGVYVELTENHCEGMIKIRDFKDDYYTFDETKYRLVGERRRRIFQLGDTIRIKVKNVDLEKKHIDFSPVLTKKHE